MINIANYLEQLLKGKNLASRSMKTVMRHCMRGELTDSQIAAFLVLMRKKGETVQELTAAAEVLLEMAHTIDLGDDLIDIVGTGGDGKNTFNVSTASSIVASAAGARVAKHGNRSVSSRSGSADVLLRAGIELQLTDEQFTYCMHQFNICFLFAPHFHEAIHKAANARKQLGIRSFFNLLGPLINPARAKKQVVGVFDSQWLMPIAKVLANLGAEHALVVSSKDGMDEISIAAPTDVIEYRNGSYTHWTIDPQQYGLAHSSIDELMVQSASESLKLIMEVFEAKKGPARDIVLLNTAAALYCSGIAPDFGKALEIAGQTIDSGAALNKLKQLQAFTFSVPEDL